MVREAVVFPEGKVQGCAAPILVWFSRQLFCTPCFRGGGDLPDTGRHGDLIGAEETRPFKDRDINRLQAAVAELGEEAHG